jgi:hypothetical protein
VIVSRLILCSANEWTGGKSPGGVSGGGRAAGKGQRFELVLQMRKNFIDDDAFFDHRNDLHLSPAFWIKQRICFVNQSNQSSPRLTGQLDPFRFILHKKAHFMILCIQYETRADNR